MLLESTSKDEIQQNIIGGKLPKPIKRREMRAKKIGLEITISLKVHLGEIVGIAGVSGNGQTPLIEAIVGLRNILSGVMLLNNTPISNKDVSILYCVSQKTKI